jgi:glycerol-3-phosphate acyltransferase PlsX
VADGFVGNTALKLAEGLAKSLMEAFFHELFEFDADLAMQLEPAAKNLAKKNDYHEYGGAPLLGVNGVCVICHGSSKAKTIASAIRNTRVLVERHVNDAIVERLAQAAPAIDPRAGGAHARS